MEVDAETSAGDLGHALSRIWRRKWWVLVPLIAMVAFSLAQSARAEKVYSSSALVRQSNPNSFLVFQVQQNQYIDPARASATQIQLAQSAAVASAVRDALGPAIRSMRSVSVSSVGETDVLRFEATSTVPEVARDAADAYTAAYLEQAQITEVSALRQQADELQGLNDGNEKKISDFSVAMADLDKQIAPLVGLIAQAPTTATPEQRAQLATLEAQRDLAETQRASLVESTQSVSQRIDQLRVEANAREQAAGQIVRPATLASSPISPRPVRDAGLYAAIGLLAGVGLALGRDAIGGRLTDIDHLHDAAPAIPVLGSPLAVEGRKRLPGRRQSASGPLVTIGDGGPRQAVEVYRALRTSIELATTEKRRTLLITSAAEREGKTTTAVNLAGSLAAAGFNVALVDADLHRPRLHEMLALDGSVGLTSVLLGRHTLYDAMQDVAVSSGSLRVLCSGPLPPNPSEVLTTETVGMIIRRLAGRYDFVILDSPPVLAVTDPIVAGRWCDHVLLVTRAGQSSSRSLRHAIARLDEALMRPLGLVFNGAVASSAGYYYYPGAATTAESATDGSVSEAEWAGLVRRNDGVQSTNGNAERQPVSFSPQGDPDRPSAS